MYAHPFDDFIHLVWCLYEHPANRKPHGDVFIHVLQGERPDIADKIRGTLFDPSGKDVVHTKVVRTVQDMW
jgi:hypothetical protein